MVRLALKAKKEKRKERKKRIRINNRIKFAGSRVYVKLRHIVSFKMTCIDYKVIRFFCLFEFEYFSGLERL